MRARVAARELGELSLWDRCAMPLIPFTGRPGLAYTDGEHVLVLGRPGEAHDCARAGCAGSIHVLYGGRIADAPLSLDTD